MDPITVFGAGVTAGITAYFIAKGRRQKREVR